MIVLFTDFGTGLYTGQVRTVLQLDAPDCPVIDLVSDAPAHNPRAAAYLLAALVGNFPADTVFVGIVDPGVGDVLRRPVIVRVDGHWFVGPDNGLFNVVALRGNDVECWDITWRPASLSASFHGRDLFAPVAAMLACSGAPPGVPRSADDLIDRHWPPDLAEVVYIDRFGNAMTGIRASSVAADAGLVVRDRVLSRQRTFSDVPAGTGFCYNNAMGLLEIAVNCGRADRTYGLEIGDEVRLAETAR